MLRQRHSRRAGRLSRWLVCTALPENTSPPSAKRCGAACGRGQSQQGGAGRLRCRPCSPRPDRAAVPCRRPHTRLGPPMPQGRGVTALTHPTKPGAAAAPRDDAGRHPLVSGGRVGPGEGAAPRASVTSRPGANSPATWATAPRRVVRAAPLRSRRPRHAGPPILRSAEAAQPAEAAKATPASSGAPVSDASAATTTDSRRPPTAARAIAPTPRAAEEEGGPECVRAQSVAGPGPTAAFSGLDQPDREVQVPWRSTAARHGARGWRTLRTAAQPTARATAATHSTPTAIPSSARRGLCR
jgi:hypothetical protein